MGAQSSVVGPAGAAAAGPKFAHRNKVNCVWIAELPSEQVGDLPIGHSQKRDCPQLTKF